MLVSFCAHASFSTHELLRTHKSKEITRPPPDRCLQVASVERLNQSAHGTFTLALWRHGTKRKGSGRISLPLNSGAARAPPEGVCNEAKTCDNEDKDREESENEGAEGEGIDTSYESEGSDISLSLKVGQRVEHETLGACIISAMGTGTLHGADKLEVEYYSIIDKKKKKKWVTKALIVAHVRCREGAG